MSRAVPAATSALRVLRFLAQRTTPVPAALIATEIGLPRSSTYHLLTAMAAESFVTHYPDDRTWGVGVAAWEVGQGYTPRTRWPGWPGCRSPAWSMDWGCRRTWRCCTAPMWSM